MAIPILMREVFASLIELLERCVSYDCSMIPLWYLWELNRKDNRERPINRGAKAGTNHARCKAIQKWKVRDKHILRIFIEEQRARASSSTIERYALPLEWAISTHGYL